MTNTRSATRTAVITKALTQDEVIALIRRREWVLPLGIFFVSRIFTTLYLLIGASHQIALNQGPAYHSFAATPSSPGYWTATTNWDGQWYQEIADRGYPRHLAMDRPTQTPYAFYPLYPMLCRSVMLVTHLPFTVVAPLITTTAAAIAVVLLYRLLRRRSGVFVSSAAIVALCVFISSPVLQVAYSESIALLLLVIAMTFLADHRYGALVATIVVLALARPVALPMLVVVAAHFWRRWRAGEVGADRLVSWPQAILVCCATGASAGLWPALAGWLSGIPNVYLETESAWPIMGRHHGGLLNPANFGLGDTLFVICLIIVWILMLRRRTDTGWSMDLRVWSGAYVGYLFMVVGPGASLLRFMLLVLVPMWPFAEDPAPNEGRADRIARRVCLYVLVIFGLIAQYLWVTHVFTVPIDPAKQLFP